MTLCQAEILHKRSRLGEPMNEEQIEEMKHKMTSLKPYHMPMPIKRFENGVPVLEESPGSVPALQPVSLVSHAATPSLPLHIKRLENGLAVVEGKSDS